METPEPQDVGEPQLPTAAELKDTIFAALVAHLHEHGPEDWHLVREQPDFAHVIGAASGSTGNRRFWRWVAKVKEGLPEDRTRPHEGRPAIDDHQAWAADQAQATAARNLPAAPPAAFFMKQGADGLIAIDMLEAVGEIWSDLQLARQDAFGGSNGARKRISAKRLTQSAGARMAVLAKAVDLMRKIYDIDALHRRYKAIVAFILTDLAEFPELQQRLLQRLKDANRPQPAQIDAESV